MKEQGMTSENKLNQEEISNRSDKEFNIMIIRMLKELGRVLDEQDKKLEV